MRCGPSERAPSPELRNRRRCHGRSHRWFRCPIPCANYRTLANMKSNLHTGPAMLQTTPLCNLCKMACSDCWRAHENWRNREIWNLEFLSDLWLRHFPGIWIWNARPVASSTCCSRTPPLRGCRSLLCQTSSSIAEFHLCIRGAQAGTDCLQLKRRNLANEWLESPTNF